MGVPAMTATKNPRNRVFAIRVGKKLLFETITTNPSKTVRFYNRLGRKDDPANDTFLSELEMRRKVVMAKPDVYIGPMR
jgi:hypothetical protein